MRTMLYERVGDVLVLAHGVEEPADDEWDPYVRFAEACQRSERPVIGLLVTTLGGAPNARQRKAIVAVSRIRRIPTCVCTSSLLARGVVTAIRWLADAPMFALRLDEIDEALRIIKVPLDQHASIQAALTRMQRLLSEPA